MQKGLTKAVLLFHLQEWGKIGFFTACLLFGTNHKILRGMSKIHEFQNVYAVAFAFQDLHAESIGQKSAHSLLENAVIQKEIHFSAAFFDLRADLVLTAGNGEDKGNVSLQSKLQGKIRCRIAGVETDDKIDLIGRKRIPRYVCHNEIQTVVAEFFCQSVAVFHNVLFQIVSRYVNPLLL